VVARFLPTVDTLLAFVAESLVIDREQRIYLSRRSGRRSIHCKSSKGDGQSRNDAIREGAPGMIPFQGEGVLRGSLRLSIALEGLLTPKPCQRNKLLPASVVSLNKELFGAGEPFGKCIRCAAIWTKS
jgi:hypothetical protein